MHFDLLISANSPAGLECAVDASLRHLRVGVVKSPVSGQSVPTGRDAARYLQAAILRLTCRQAGADRSISYETARRTALRQWQREQQFQLERLKQMDAEFITGEWRPLSPHAVEISKNGVPHVVRAQRIVGLCSPEYSHRVPAADTVRRIGSLVEFWNVSADCRRLVIAGSSTTAMELASLFLKTGMHVDLIADLSETLMTWDSEIADDFVASLRSYGCRLINNAHVEDAEVAGDGIVVGLSDGGQIEAHALLTDSEADSLRIHSSEMRHPTESWNSCHVPGVPEKQTREIHSIPAVAMAGATEEQLIAEDVPFVAGCALVSSPFGNQEDSGRLKLLFHRDSRRLLGVHCIGEHAAQFTHLGCVVMKYSGTLDYIRQSIFSDSPAVEPFRNASLDAMEKIGRFRDRPALQLFDPHPESQHIASNAGRYRPPLSLV